MEISGIRDIRMIQKSFEQRWPIGADQRKVLIERLMKVVANPRSKHREAISASRAIIAAMAQNQADEHKLVDVANVQQRNDRLSDIARELGIDPSLIVDATSQSDGGTTSDEDQPDPDTNNEAG